MFRIWVFTAKGRALSTGDLTYTRLADTLTIARKQNIEYIIYEG